MIWCQQGGKLGRNKFLETYNLLRLNQEQTENLNRLVTNDKSKSVIKKKPNKCSGPDGSTGEFYQTFKEELTPVLLKLLQKIQEEGRLPSSFYEAPITLTVIPGKHITKKEHYKPISLMDIDTKTINKILAN